jgi:hypothetical protein
MSLANNQDKLYPSLISVEDKLKIYKSEKSKYFKDDNIVADSTTTHNSESGKYELTITQYKSEEKAWKYTLGTVYSVISGQKQVIAEIQRNYHTFPYCFIEDHPNGHDYLICGEDYQGQTIIELDSGKRKDWIPAMGGYCWKRVTPSPSKTLLLVDGCYWACASDSIIVDFSDPLNPPFERLTDSYSINGFKGWNEDDSCEIEIEYETRKSDGKALFELSEEEKDALEQQLEPGTNQTDIFGYDVKWITWKKS